MQIGIKTGPRTWAEAKRIIAEQDVTHLEIWYRYDQPELYTEMLDYLKEKQINFGFHYWGVVLDRILPSFCYQQEDQYRAGIDSIKTAIDAAAAAGANYVNYHPGSRVLTRLNEDFNKINIVDKTITDEATALKLLLAATHELSEYGKARNVRALVETMPKFDGSHWDESEGRLTVIETHHASLAMIEAVAAADNLVTNDFGHTAASLVSDDRNQLWEYLRSATLSLAPQTALLHINTVTEPFNGTDSHNGILSEDWQAGAFPNEAQFLELLKPFLDRDDVWTILEPPEGKMLENYIALRSYRDQLLAGKERS